MVESQGLRTLTGRMCWYRVIHYWRYQDCVGLFSGGAMKDELEKRILEKEVWTFKECLALAADLKLKTRFVVAAVLAAGKDYIDGDHMERINK
ncbi:MAG: hypothetical protein QF515_18320 [Pseudomonadales bacterium]|jgi:hypothetical protein|nr:hypothetical protein [Pseudomonadales bacterium]MDP6829049.1 hypothetical protein [Pseudomonadales bacterium]|tara:strand:- start:2637 stop:2915 length:279 start_codon:yes stop_codon:yes gene_type:complete